MNVSIAESIRKKVAQRANYSCEYCLLKEHSSFFRFHVEHIRSIKHGGSSEMDNLAYSCPDCNYAKGTDIGTFLDSDDLLVRFFHPRKDKWGEHFDMDNGAIYGKTLIGKATEKIFKLNDPDRLIFRKQLISLEQYP